MTIINRPMLMGTALSLCFFFVGCGGSSSTTLADDENTDNTNITLATTYKADAGRLLGSQCAQCHGTNGVSVNEWDSIAGESDLADEIFDDEPIMTAQAHGYTSEEITLIGNWLNTLNKNDD